MKIKKVFVNGDFNILHPGHLRLLKFAKESGDYLVVGVNSDKKANNKNLLDEQTRLESIKATSYVDEAFLIDISVSEYIKQFKPDIVVKGKEHENSENLELEVLNTYGGKLIFTSGEIGFSSLDLLKKDLLQTSGKVEQNQSYIKRHNLKFENLKTVVDKFENLNILVVGDTIIDEYITCEAIGMSQEDPTIVVSPLIQDKFIGGAAIVASHAKTLGAKVSFVSVLGDDENFDFVKNGLTNLGIDVQLHKDSTRPTTLKQRFRASGKTLLRVNHLKQHSISKDIEESIMKDINQKLDIYDLIIFSDFSYGVLSHNLINNLIVLGSNKKIMMSADSQSSSQIGDISKFKNMTLITPTEREIRLSLGDFESGLVVTSQKLTTKSNAKYIFTTLGAEGMMIYNSSPNELLTDNINALGNMVKDVSGAGDSLLTCSSMALCVGATVWESAYLGSIAAAIQVSRIGNVPIKKEEILKELR